MKRFGGGSGPSGEGALARPWFGSAVLVLSGGYLAVQGTVLLSLGGSAYYVSSGVVLLAAGLLLFARRREGLWLYALFLIATAMWALWEVGLDGWSLLPRLLAPLVLGLLLCGAWVRRRLQPAVAGRPLSRLIGPLPLLVLFALACVSGVSLHAVNPQPPDPIYQRGMEAFPALPADAISPTSASRASAPGRDWPVYGGDPGGSRFSPLQQIDSTNVSRLKIAWVYRTGPSPQGARATLEVNPLKIGGTVYLCTSVNELIALDADSGRLRWRYDPHVETRYALRGICRGVAYYKNPNVTAGECAERIITATIDAQLIAVDAHSGKPCVDFGANGHTSLLVGMGEVPKGYYYVSSAPTIVRGRIIVGGWVSDGQFWGEPSGVIRGYDAQTGRFSWAFDAGRPDDHGEPAEGQTYTASTPNSWGPMSGDEELGLVYAPTGNSVPDYYGAQRRPFDDQYSSSVLALEAETGKVRWAFQTVHHDIWDYDVASQPVLFDLPDTEGHTTPALIQGTKRGEIFLLDRRNGKPLSQVVERAVPQRGAAPGERVAATQPFSTGLPSFRGPDLTERDMWGVSPFDQLWCRIQFKRARYEGPLTPPGLTPNIQYPGYLGGLNWWSESVNPELQVMIVNADRMANYDRLMPRAEADRLGIHPMPDGSEGDVGGTVAQQGTPFAGIIRPFLSPLFMPCQAPPYGTLSAVNLRTGKLIWTQPLGTASDNGPFGIPSGLPFTMGAPQLGGSLSTRGGVTFIAATTDRTFRAFETTTGRLLWSDRLPAGSHSTPASYLSSSGRQMIVIAAAGLPAFGSKPGDYIMAYALP